MYEIWSYGNNDALFGIFNAMAAIMGSGNYLSAMIVVIVCGFFTAFVAYAFAPSQMVGWKWLASVTLIYAVLFVPKVTVGIVDKLSTQPVQVVSNVPFGAAAFAALTSSVGNLLTEMFETAFQVLPGPAQLPADLTYQKHGLMFGSKLIRQTLSVHFSDPSFATDMINFLANCTQYDLSQNLIDVNALAQSTNVWPMLATTNAARFSPLTAAGGGTLAACPDVWRNLDRRMPAAIQQEVNRIAAEAYPAQPPAVAVTIVGNAILAAYTRAQIGGAAASASDIVRQNAMLNAFSGASKITGQRTNDPASLLLSMGQQQARTQVNASWITFGKMAEEALPMIRNVLEAVMYALFPVVILMLFVTYGRGTVMMLKSYLITLVWLQTWPILYAILNYMGTLASAKAQAASGFIAAAAGAGLTLQTADPIYSTTISAQAVVGYLLLVALPTIAWGIVKGFDSVGQSGITGVGALQGAITGNAGGAALGNVSSGNVSMDQLRLAPTKTSAYMNTWQDNRTGDTFHDNVLSGVRAISFLQNEGYASMSVGAGRDAAVQQRMASRISAATNDVVSAMHERAAIYGDAVAKSRSHGGATDFSTGFAKDTSGGTTRNASEVAAEVDQAAKAVALDQRIAGNLLFSAAAAASTGAGDDRGGVGAALRGNIVRTYGEEIGRKYDTIVQTMTDERAAKLTSYANNFSNNASFRSAVLSSNQAVKQFESRLSENRSHTERAEASLQNELSFAEDASLSSTQADRFAIDLLRDPRNSGRLLEIARSYAGSPAAARAAVDAELASMSVLTRPTRYMSGRPAEVTADAVRQQHASDLGDSRLSSSAVDAANARNRARVGPVSRESSAAPGDLVKEVRKGIDDARIEQQVKEGLLNGRAQQQSERNSDIIGVRPGAPSGAEPDGAFATNRSPTTSVIGSAIADGTNRLSDNLETAKKVGRSVLDWIRK